MLMMSEMTAAGSEMDPLDSLYQAAHSRVQNGQPVQVVFDIDDTLFWVKPRKQAIFAVMSEEEAQLPEVATALQRLVTGPVLYDVGDALRHVGVLDPVVIARLRSRFFELFFDGMYTVYDEPVLGAVQYVQRLHAVGARIVYLSGRPETMLAWTRNTLGLAGFPVDDARTSLILKPSAHQHMGDAAFKGWMATQVGQDENGPVLACFDNEPANLNAMHGGFQHAAYFWLRTDGLPNPPALQMKACELHHFLNTRERLRLAYEASPDRLPSGLVIGA